MSYLKDAGFFLAIMVAFLYVISSLQFNSYLTAIGVETDFIARSFEQVLYGSLHVLPGLLGIFVFILTIIIILIVLMLVFSKIIYAEDSSQKNNFVVEKIKLIFNTPLLKIFSTIVTIFVFIYSLDYISDIGKDEGKKFVKDIQAKAHELITLSKDKKNIYVLACGINNCAGINTDTNEIIYFENKFINGEVSNSIKKYQ